MTSLEFQFKIVSWATQYHEAHVKCTLQHYNAGAVKQACTLDCSSQTQR